VSFSKWLRPEAGGWLSRWSYYLSSIPTLLFKIRRPQTVIGAFLGLSARRPFQIRLADGTRFFVRNALDIWLVKENCLDGDYERGEVPIRNGWTVVDIGAGLGEFAVWVARRHPKSIVYAFEPLPESFALLVENVRLNGLSNVRPIQKAVFAAEGMVRLHAPSGLAGQHRRAAAGSKPARRSSSTAGKCFRRPDNQPSPANPSAIKRAGPRMGYRAYHDVMSWTDRSPNVPSANCVFTAFTGEPHNEIASVHH
jgi:FkbM family methyltransferase